MKKMKKMRKETERKSDASTPSSSVLLKEKEKERTPEQKEQNKIYPQESTSIRGENPLKAPEILLED